MMICKENYKTIYKRLFTLCSCLKTKESYDRWVTRRVWGFRHQISKAKYLKMSITNIRKLKENTTAVRARELWNFAAKGQHFRSPRLISQPCKNLPLAWSDRLPMAITPSFQLRIIHRLKHWIIDFLSFEMTYSIHKLDSKKYSKSVWHECHQECFMTGSSLLPLLAFRICLWQRTLKLWFFMFLSFPLLCHGFQRTLLNLGLLWWSNY